jgi:outer membrane protein assembly factor BamB
MDTTITQLLVTRPTAGNLKVGQTLQIGAQAIDATGASVLTLPANISYTVTSGVGVVSINPVTHLVTAQSVGTATITITDSESGKTGSTVITVVPTGLAKLSPWGKFRGDLQNTGHAGANVLGNATAGVESWVAAAGSAVGFSSPAVAANGDVFIGSYDGSVYAFTSAGVQKWKRVTGGPIDSSPAVSEDGTIYVGSADGNLYALNPVTGSVIWTRPVPAAITGGPSLSPDGIIYFGTAAPDNKVYAADALSGVILGTFSGATDSIDSSPALSLDNKTLYVGSQDGSVYAVNVSNPAALTQSWKFSTGGQIYVSSPVVAPNGDIFIGATDGRLYGLTSAGLLKAGFPFSVPSGAPIYGSPALSQDGATVYFGVFDNVSGLDENKVYAITAATATPLWESPVLGGPVSASPTIGQDGTIYIGAYDGKLYALNGATGAIKAGYPFSTGVNSTIDSSVGLGANGTVYFGDFNGKVHAVK